MPDLTISIVSHSQAGLVQSLLNDIRVHCPDVSFEVILTLNLDETLPFTLEGFSFPIRVIRNLTPLGFSANHNQAFMCAEGQFFCVLNPDVRFDSNPFPPLLASLKNATIGVAAPLVLGEDGKIEDSARYFPTPCKIICKLFGKCTGSDYLVNEALVFPDWVGGMFMLFPRHIFERLNGFDQSYFLYYEDVDLCARMRLLGYEVVLCPDAKVIHHAHRSSHRNFRFLLWHLSSMMRFFFSPVYWRVQCRKWL